VKIGARPRCGAKGRVGEEVWGGGVGGVSRVLWFGDEGERREGGGRAVGGGGGGVGGGVAGGIKRRGSAGGGVRRGGGVRGSGALVSWCVARVNISFTQREWGVGG